MVHSNFAVAFSATAILVAVAFTASTLERWLARRRPYDLAWSAAMALFALGALAYFFGVATGWSPWSFKLFYLSGGVLTVPVLALGTVYLLAGRRWGNRISLAVALIGAFAAGVILTAPLLRPLDPDRLNAGREVLGVLPRILAAAGSGVGALVVIVGALWSAWRLWRGRGRPGSGDGARAAGARPLAAGRVGAANVAAGRVAADHAGARHAAAEHVDAEHVGIERVGAANVAAGRVAAANVAIAVGTLLISVKRPFELLTGSDETGFALALSVGLTVMFAGFLLASTPSARGRTRSDRHPISTASSAADRQPHGRPERARPGGARTASDIDPDATDGPVPADPPVPAGPPRPAPTPS